MITNRAKLARTPTRADALAIVEAGLAALDTKAIISRLVGLDEEAITIDGVAYPRSQLDRVIVIGIGKCAYAAAHALEERLGDVIDDGVIVDVRCPGSLKRVRTCEGTHPYPSDQNVAFTRQMLSLLDGAGERDLVLAVISGGGSTLLCQPQTHTCEDERVLVEHLFQKGATIQEINTLRKHLSRARGGQVAAAAYPARVVSLIFSDVPSDDLSVIASGPTVLDTTTRDDAIGVAQAYHCKEQLGFGAEHFFETPKDESLFSRVRSILALTNQTALDAMERSARERGYDARVCTAELQGEAREVAARVVQELHGQQAGSALLYGGETTVTLGERSGKGGRNQEFALAALSLLAEDELVLACASDGWDNSDHAGALADATTLAEARAHGLDPRAYLARHDSYAFFHSVGDALISGYTGANVSDVVLALKTRHRDLKTAIHDKTARAE